MLGSAAEIAPRAAAHRWIHGLVRLAVGGTWGVRCGERLATNDPVVAEAGVVDEFRIEDESMTRSWPDGRHERYTPQQAKTPTVPHL